MKISHPESIQFSCSKLHEDQKKGFSLKFSHSRGLHSNLVGPKLGAGQKQRSLPTVCVLKPSAQVTKERVHVAILHTILR